MPARPRYFVINQDGRWMIKSGGQLFGPYRSEQQAINIAIDTAYEAKRGAQVFVQTAGDQFRPEWTYGSDPYPPLRPQQMRPATDSDPNKKA